MCVKCNVNHHHHDQHKEEDRIVHLETHIDKTYYRKPRRWKCFKGKQAKNKINVRKNKNAMRQFYNLYTQLNTKYACLCGVLPWFNLSFDCGYICIRHETNHFYIQRSDDDDLYADKLN